MANGATNEFRFVGITHLHRLLYGGEQILRNFYRDRNQLCCLLYFHLR